MSAPFRGLVRNFASITRAASNASVLVDTSKIPTMPPDAGTLNFQLFFIL